MQYRLSKAAESDLISIARFGDKRFGVRQSDRYRRKLTERFEVLAGAPELFPLVDHIRPSYRRAVCGVHSVYFKVMADHVLIVRILKHQDSDNAIGR